MRGGIDRSREEDAPDPEGRGEASTIAISIRFSMEGKKYQGVTKLVIKKQRRGREVDGERTQRERG